MRNQFFKTVSRMRLGFGTAGLRILVPGLLLVFLFAQFGCSKRGIHSIVISNPGIQSESNDLNDLGNPYKKKKLVFPQAVVKMSQEERNRWLDTLSQYVVHRVDTSIKIGIMNTPGLAFLEIPACAKKGVAILVLDAINTKRGGKVIDVEMRYVCKSDNPGVNWDLPGRVWAATPDYKIDVMDEWNNCFDGFQSIEFQFSPEKENPVLRSVLIICAKE